MSKVLDYGTNVARSAVDMVVGASGQLTLFLVTEDGGFPPDEAMIHIDLKSEDDQYMTQQTLTKSKSSWTLNAAPGTIVSVERVASDEPVGVDAVGQE